MPTICNIESDVAVKSCGISKIYRYRGLISSLFSGSFRSEVAALKDFSFEVKKGEILGIIGSNGSGKSTLMKVLSGVTTPTSGTAVVNGKIFAAIEVTGGFNPDLTGYNNLLLTAKIWGFSNDFIRKRLPEIIAFSGLQDFIHLPVKKYSSGMISRLASSLIVHTDADVILLDEVLNGSDLQFRQKMHKKIVELHKQNKTVIFASHTLVDILSLCNRTIIIHKGEKKYEGNPFKALHIYREEIKGNKTEALNHFELHHEKTFLELTGFAVKQGNGMLTFDFSVKARHTLTAPASLVMIFNNNIDSPVAHSIHVANDLNGLKHFSCSVPATLFSPGNHYITFTAFAEPDYWMFLPRICGFAVENSTSESHLKFIPGMLLKDAVWKEGNV